MKVMLSLMVAALILLCNNRPAMAEDTGDQLAQVQGVELLEARANVDCNYFVNTCVLDLSSSCISQCCESYDNRLPRDYKCACWRAAERTNLKALQQLSSYCGFTKPTQCPHNIQVGALDNNSTSSKMEKVEGEVSCCEKDKEKIKECMFNTESIDRCCPAFRLMLGRKCDCYNYANDLDNQLLITLESYCDITNPCKTTLQVM